MIPSHDPYDQRVTVSVSVERDFYFVGRTAKVSSRGGRGKPTGLPKNTDMCTPPHTHTPTHTQSSVGRAGKNISQALRTIKRRFRDGAGDDSTTGTCSNI